MKTDEYPLSPPSLDELADILRPSLESNFITSSISVSACPDLREAPFHLAAEGLSGHECVADIGGQPNLFPSPRLDAQYSLLECARAMGLSSSQGMLIGAGAGPWFHVGSNCELAPNLAWHGSYDAVRNATRLTRVDAASRAPRCEPCPSTDCALMMNLYGSAGLPGPVLRIAGRGRRGDERSFTECVRHALARHYGQSRPVSLGGVFVIKAGRSNFHVMPDFPPKEQLPFKDPKQLNDWLTYHDFTSSPDAPIVCLTVFHSADPDKEMGLRMEHTHCFTADGSNRGGHYHYDLEGEEVEYEAYFNTAKAIYRIDRPEVTLEKDLHD